MPKLKKVTKKISYYRNKADKTMQEWGRNEYDSCEVCGRQMSCLHHFFPKSTASALRYEPDNLIPICNTCHYQHHTKSDPRIHATIIENRGIEWYQNLKRKKEQIIKPNKSYYQEQIKKWEGD